MEWNKIKITQNGKDFKMDIDGVEVKGILQLQYTHADDEFPSIGMEFLCVGEVELDIEKGEI